uniref:Uncharacterized protein n=1 Tax=Cebus imitator TaxID=2715852 RepID=A0A2K5PVY6_CEBIM
AAKVPREDSNAQEMPALEPAFGKISPLSADEEKKPKYTGGKSQSATLLGQRSSSNNLAPPKVTLRAYHLQRINSGQTPPQEDGDKNTSGRHPDSSATRTGRPTPWAERRGTSEDGKAMHPSSRSPQNSSGRKSPGQASQATTLQEQTAAVGGDDGGSSVLEGSEGGFLSHVQPDELTDSSANTAELQVGGLKKLCFPMGQWNASRMDGKRPCFLTGQS